MLKRYKFNVEIKDKNTFCMKFKILQFVEEFCLELMEYSILIQGEIQ